MAGHVNRTTGRTHGCTDQACDVKILLANREPSTHGTSRQFAATQYLGRFRGEADMNRLMSVSPVIVDAVPPPVDWRQLVQCSDSEVRISSRHIPVRASESKEH